MSSRDRDHRRRSRSGGGRADHRGSRHEALTPRGGGSRRDAGSDKTPTRGGDRNSSRNEASKPLAVAVASPLNGRQLAKAQVEKEKEKARLKKLQREEAQKEKERVIEEKKRKRTDSLDDSEQGNIEGDTLVIDGTTSNELERKLNALSAPETTRQAASMATPEPVQPPAAPHVRGSDRKKQEAETLEEPLARRLFDLLVRGGRTEVSRRDVLVALRRQPQARRLFGLPVQGTEEGGSTLEARLLSIQDSFETNSCLGEIEPRFGELLRGDGRDDIPSTSSFGWNLFFKACRRSPMRARAVAAAALLPREHALGADFAATREWTEVPEGAACPAGLEFKMDMETGRTLARLPP